MGKVIANAGTGNFNVVDITESTMGSTMENTAKITRESYFEAREGLQKLVQERQQVYARGLEALRRWLAAGVGARWLELAERIRQARCEDLAQAMWWELEWHAERRRQQRQEQKEQEVQRWVACAQKPTPASIGPRPRPAFQDPPKKPLDPQRMARSFAPSGRRWPPASSGLS